MNKDLEKIIKEIECYQNEDMCIIMLSQKENKALLDYITNLQQENERLKEYVNCRIQEFKNAGKLRKEIKAHHYYMMLCDIEKILNSSL